MPKKLLLADDSITIQKVIGITFANEDFDLTITDNGDDAIAKAKEVMPDIILADVVMPGKDGYEVCEAIKKNSATAGIPVLLLAGTFESFDEDKANSVGADDHISKPFESQELINKVKELLARGAKPIPSAASAEPPAAPSAVAPAEPATDNYDPIGGADISELSAEPMEPEPIGADELDSPAPIPPSPAELDSPGGGGVDYSAFDDPASEAAPAPGQPGAGGEDMWSVDEFNRYMDNPNAAPPPDPDMDDDELDNTQVRFEKSQAQAAAEAEPMELDPEPAEAEPEFGQLEPEPEPMDLEPEPEPVELEPEPVELEPEPAELEPEPAELEPEPAELEPEPVELEPEPAELEPEPVELEPEPEPEPIELAEVGDDDMQVQAFADDPHAGTETAEPSYVPAESGVKPVELEPEPESAELELDAESAEPELDPVELEPEPAEEENLLAPMPEQPTSTEEAAPLAGGTAGAGEDVKAMEKVAWEVVPELAEKIIREIVQQKLEEILWEVVPDLAESAISEKIKKLTEGV